MKTLEEAFHHTLQDICYAETALTKALPNVAKAAGNADFKALVLAHLAETKQQIVILDKVFASIGKRPAGVKCDAIDGLIKETDGIINGATGIALDACLTAAAQAVEHYEIARYGALREWAKVLAHTEAHDLLSQILDMEKAANSKLTGVAVNEVNMAKKAAWHGIERSCRPRVNRRRHALRATSALNSHLPCRKPPARLRQRSKDSP
jgi:ferritin-like metal-binding protein YciE